MSGKWVPRTSPNESSPVYYQFFISLETFEQEAGEHGGCVVSFEWAHYEISAVLKLGRYICQGY